MIYLAMLACLVIGYCIGVFVQAKRDDKMLNSLGFRSYSRHDYLRDAIAERRRLGDAQDYGRTLE